MILISQLFYLNKKKKIFIIEIFLKKAEQAQNFKTQQILINFIICSEPSAKDYSTS